MEQKSDIIIEIQICGDNIHTKDIFRSNEETEIQKLIIEITKWLEEDT